MRSTVRPLASAAWLLAAGAAGTGAQQPTSPEARRPEVADAEVFTPARYAVADFYENVRYFGASWSPDRRKLLVSSNATGIFNAYAIPTAGGTPRQLTSSTGDAVFAQSYFPADERIVYTSDQGGNELTHVYVRTPDGKVTDVTPGDKHKAEFGGWSGDRRAFYVSTNERDQRYFDLYKVATDGLARTLLFRNETGMELGPVSRDERWIALVKPRTTNDADIYLQDLRGGAPRNITTHTGNVNSFPAAFSPDGATLLFVSDSGGEFASLRS